MIKNLFDLYFIHSLLMFASITVPVYYPFKQWAEIVKLLLGEVEAWPKTENGTAFMDKAVRS